MDRKIDFFIVGAAKSGTTSLFNVLAMHPNIYLPRDKEPHFWGDMKPRGKRDIYRNFEEYMELFKEGKETQLLGEASTGYLYSKTAAQEIYTHNSNARIIILLRNPVERAYSLYWHHVRDFKEDLSFEQALALESKRISEKDGFGFHYLTSGFYYTQVKTYIDVFGRDNVKVYLFEDIIESFESVINSICDYLSISSDFAYKAVSDNKSGSHRSKLIGYIFASDNKFRKTMRMILPKRFGAIRRKIIQANLEKSPPMDPETRLKLVSVFEEDVSMLEKLIGRDLSKWKN